VLNRGHARAFMLALLLSLALISSARAQDLGSQRPDTMGPAIRAGSSLTRPDLPVDETAINATLKQLPEGGQRFILSETRSFVVLSDAPIPWTRRQAETLERARHQFERFAHRLASALPGQPPVAHALEHKLLCVLFQDHSAFRIFAAQADGVQARWVAGYYAPKANRLVFYNDETSDDYAKAKAAIESNEAKAREWRAKADLALKQGPAEKAKMLERAAGEAEALVRAQRQRLERQSVSFGTGKTIHEAVHMLAFNTGLQARGASYPFWLSEGLATSFEADDASGAFGPGRAGSKSSRDLWAERLKALQAQAEDGDLEWQPFDSWLDQTMASGGLAHTPETGAGDPERQARTVEGAYARAAVMFEWLVRYRKQELAAYLVDLTNSPIVNAKPGEHRARFVEHFGDPAAIERKMGP
jgi:Protein of unknown function (DUF1570)